MNAQDAVTWLVYMFALGLITGVVAALTRAR